MKLSTHRRKPSRCSSYKLLLQVPRIRKGALNTALGYGAHVLKMRMLLWGCIFFFTLLVFEQRLPHLMGWNHHPPPPPPPPPPLPSRGGYTVVINTWKRHPMLKRAVAHYATCSQTHAIRVVWSESDKPPDSLDAYLTQIISQAPHKPSLRFELNEEDNLNNRFKPIQDVANDAVFSVDDDVIVPCPALNLAFSVWQTAPHTMVGFVPRMHWLHHQENGITYYKYGGWWSVWWMGTYSMILSKAAFFHRKYLDVYTYDMPSSIHDYITIERNCEDIAMSLLVANASGAPPIWVRARIYEIGSSGISSLKGHTKKRDKCLNDFISLYGAVPLVATNIKAVDASQEWFW
ncbi:uncharacterized protein A4U43_C08F10 [Asparagus officinalis]|nr:uncharacterized protein A4U43_C08F10 [Asparagus officinalis]